ncbi:cytochrome c maturation protein CcmE [Moraxella bovis]|uniref:Cytochrome c-type biogenesis protein CcmE n=1 Tax=Moraxella bovis TaxID=476 RepID=A0A378PS47_MORBO|nr:cytochrome c maturation protein CcmE [Moraxella bovis]UYZ71432.1 cytochrome c maturation protein CcmE [Moraxella bovis]UYZ72655.1 cytochrome c maturation protein CcmE [Moraxella bovis]UZA14726.1 cytochrome c maturation protein CcmE [Moraxella bovis]UZA42533.1 cytochrome c maturation protein CcmE [Moraxella bovis]STY91314.1 Heme chaperone CcmE [Moraxella bovis]
MNNARQKKLMWVIAMLVGVAVAVGLILYAIRQQTDYYFDPTAITAGKAPENKRIRAGGMVVAGSVKRDPNDPLNIQFQITDYKAVVPMTYRGVLPDLFAENSGVVATGELQGGTFVASEVLAKHDENYMPPEVAKSLKAEHAERGTDVNNGQFIPATSMAEIDQRQAEQSQNQAQAQSDSQTQSPTQNESHAPQ